MPTSPDQTASHNLMERRASIVAAILFGITGVLVFIVLPGFVQGLVDLGHITGQQAGFVTSCELAGFAVTMIVLSIISHRVAWRPLLVAFILLEAVGNAACIAADQPHWLAVARFITGLGSGGLMSLSFSAIGMTRNPDRYFGFLGMWMLIYGALGLLVLPSILSAFGLHGFFVIVSAVTLSTLLLVRYMPREAHAHAVAEEDHAVLSAGGRALAVLSIFVFFIGCGMLWDLVSLIGTNRGLGAQTVATVLAISQIPGIAGAFTAGAMGSRFGRFIPLASSILACALASVLLDTVTASGLALFAGMTCLFNFSWNLAQPVYLGAAAGFDPQGRLVPKMAAAQAVGLAGGPLVGALLGGETHSTAVLMYAAGAFLLSLAIIAVPFVDVRRKVVPTAIAA